MKVKIWGCRGSIPAPGKNTLVYGGESTCVEITSDEGESLIIDAGSGIRKLGDKILKDDQKNIVLLFTHAHWDHLSGFPFFRPAYFTAYNVSLCGGPVPQGTVMKYITHQMEPPYFPVSISAMKANFTEGCHCSQGFCNNSPGGRIKSIKCSSIPLNHPDGGYGFRFVNSGKSFVFLTDNELRYQHEGGRTTEDYINFCRDADLLIHDAQYTEDEYKRTVTWGHSTFGDAINLALKAGVKRLGLFHHDPDRTDDEIDHQVEIYRRYINEKGIPLDLFACAEGMVINI